MIRAGSRRLAWSVALVHLLASAALARASDWDEARKLDPTAEYTNEFYQGMIDELWRRPVRDLTRDRRSRRLLRKHPVFVSLTTSPDRIDRIHHVLATLDLTHVRKVLVVLPMRFGRTGQPYEIPAELRDHRKVKILRIPKDLGPISKMLPAIEHARAIDRRALVISVDDDIGYPRGMIPEMIYQLARSRMTAFSGSAPSIDRFGIDPATWRFPADRDARVVEGWAGIGYRAGDVHTGLLRQLSPVSRETLTSDDLVISYALAATRVRKAPIRNEYFDRRHLRHFPHGFGADALHRGAGLSSPEPRVDDHTPVKYQRALEHLDRAYGARGRRPPARMRTEVRRRFRAQVRAARPRWRGR